MIRVEREAVGSRGTCAYTVVGTPLSGFSRQPLLDACRQLKATGEAPTALVGLFRGESESVDMTCSVGVGAGLTVEETGLGPRFREFRETKAKAVRV